MNPGNDTAILTQGAYPGIGKPYRAFNRVEREAEEIAVWAAARGGIVGVVEMGRNMIQNAIGGDWRTIGLFLRLTAIYAVAVHLIIPAAADVILKIVLEFAIGSAEGALIGAEMLAIMDTALIAREARLGFLLTAAYRMERFLPVTGVIAGIAVVVTAVGVLASAAISRFVPATAQKFAQGVVLVAMVGITLAASYFAFVQMPWVFASASWFALSWHMLGIMTALVVIMNWVYLLPLIREAVEAAPAA
ncbi:MAG: hypothetical protein LBF49_00020 [Puniceicoccales bacterium]|jgi:hypothetical protein|nr:hypothetical protein [Puniceicoccales bacterium]